MQTDILNLLQNGRWKQEGNLIIPAYLTKRMLSAVDVSSAVYLTHQEAFGKKYTQEEMKIDLAQLSVEDCMIVASKILTILENEGRIDTNIQKGIAQELFDGEYTYKLLKRVYPSSPQLGSRLVREFTYLHEKERVKTVDNILINFSSLMLLETKVSQLQVYSTGVVGDLEAFRKDVGKIIVKAFKTIQRTKEDFQKGLLREYVPIEPKSIKNFYPIVITYSAFIQFPLVWKIVEEEVRNIPGYDADLLNNLQIIQSDELEILESFLEASGITFETLVQRKIADPVYKQLSFHIYLENEFKQFRQLKSKYLRQKFDQFVEMVSLKVLGKKIDIPLEE